MDSWWVGTVSTLAGAGSAALLQAWRDRTVYRRQMHTRWDESLLAALVDYLTTADCTIRAFLRWRVLRDSRPADAAHVTELAEVAAEALASFESLHEKSQAITLLTGDRNDAVRAAARGMREPLVALREEVTGGRHVANHEVAALVAQHREARTTLIAAGQTRLGVLRTSV